MCVRDYVCSVSVSVHDLMLSKFVVLSRQAHGVIIFTALNVVIVRPCQNYECNYTTQNQIDDCNINCGEVSEFPSPVSPRDKDSLRMRNLVPEN